MPSLAGTKIDKYRIVEEVGHGGMAVVYRGHDTVLEREVAVKVLHAHLADREESRARLQREALAVAKLRHDNILEIFDYSGGTDAESYIVTEFIHGPTMREWIDDKLDPRPTVAAMIVHRLCLALQEAHRVGIVHRDIKPENVMVRDGDGALKLMDFGIAQILDDEKLTLTGQLIGSPAYMAPELISGRPLDQRTDLFSLGILLYQLATGTLPFSGRNPHEVLNRIADGDFPPPSSICPLVDRDLEAIIEVSLATSPDERYQSAETFAKELERYLEETGVSPTPAELKAYFNDPTTYVCELDERVAKTLMDRAAVASQQGHTARAVALLGRVLEIDNAHSGARALLDKVRRRERRLRHMLLAAGALALTGLIAAGVMLVPEATMPGQVAAAASDSSAAARGKADPTERSSNSGADPSTELLATLPSSDPSETSVSPAAERDEDAVAPPQPATAGDPPASDTASAAPTPADVQPVAVRPPPGRRPKRTNPAPSGPQPFSCKVQLTNIPFSTARNHKLQVGNRETLAIDARTIPLKLERETTVGLTGGNWRGTLRLTPELCAKGTVNLPAQPRPAKVSISGVPPKTVIKCMKGCAGDDIGANQATDKVLRPIPLDGSGSQRVVFKLQAEGYRPKRVERTVHAGAQTLQIKLERRE
ncbi:MAG: protein kinase domain-containing protein [Nannocystales bacterium]